MDARPALTHRGSVTETLMNGRNPPAQLNSTVRGWPEALRPAR
jgi:hypothetical protein